MPTTIEALELQVQSNGASAVAGLDALSASLTKLKNATKGGVGLTAVVTATNALPTANSRAGKSYVGLAARAGATLVMFRKLKSVLSGWITQSNKYIEDLNLFNVSMGEYAEKAHEYAEKVSEVMGIDPAEWMRNQGIFNTIIKGFGMVEDRAYTMSKNLTQLGYDLSSFFNISYEDAFQKLQAGISGELEPLRRLGYDLSVARLQQEALNLGITKSVNAMTQAEKSELRYYAIMTQVTAAQGDMARTLTAPANQLRVLQAQVTQAARAFGNLFIPALNAVLPYAIAVVKVLRMVAEAIASLFHLEIPEVDFGGISVGVGAVGDLTGSADDAAGALGGAAEKAKELKRTLLGIDELNVLPAQNVGAGAGGAGIGGVGGSGLDFALPEYDFLGEAIDNAVNDILAKWKPFIDWVQEHMDGILRTAAAIGTALLAWKVSNDLIRFLEWFKNLKPSNLKFGIEFKTLGLAMFLADLNEFMKYLDDLKENGPTFHNVAGMLSEFAGMVGDISVVLGHLKLGGALKFVQGLGEIAVAVEDISKNNINWGNVRSLTRGLTNLVIGVGVFTGHIKVAAWGVVVQGLLDFLPQLKELGKGLATGNWEGFDAATLVVSALEVVGGLAVAFDVFSKIKGVTGAAQAPAAMQQLTDVTGSMNDAAGGLSPKLTDLAKNLGMGLVILTEVAAAALIFGGAVVLLGKELEQVGIAWQPVLGNGATVTAGIVTGTAILAGVGIVTAALGSAGKTLAVNIGIGTAILAELGLATGLFLVEIWAIGKGLDEIGQAWQPVLDNGETIKTAILTGTGLLVGVGVVTAALGAVTVASGLTLPLAIAAGTGVLVGLSGAVVKFTGSLVDVADEMTNELAPALEDFNAVLPSLTDDMNSFIGYMSDFAGYVADYSKNSAAASFDATVATIVSWFTADPFQKLADDVNDTYEQTKGLNEKLNLAVPELETATRLLTDYAIFCGMIAEITDLADGSVISGAIFIDMKDAGAKLIVGFSEGIKENAVLVTAAMDTVYEAVNSGLAAVQENAENCRAQIETDTRGAMQRIRADVGTNLTGMNSSTASSLSNLRNTNRTAWMGIEMDSTAAGGSMRTHVGAEFSGMNSAVTGTLNGLKSANSSTWSNIASAASGAGSRARSSVTSEFTSMSSQVGNTVRSMHSTVAAEFGSLAGSAWSWGSDLANSIASGISSGISAVASAASALAAKVRSYLHFSVPDVGPLSDFDTYMPDMLHEMANGIRSNEDVVVREVDGLAANIAAGMRDALTAAGNYSAIGAMSATRAAVPSYAGYGSNDYIEYGAEEMLNDLSVGTRDSYAAGSRESVQLLRKILDAVQSGKRIAIDGHELFSVMQEQERRAAVRTGAERSE